MTTLLREPQELFNTVTLVNNKLIVWFKYNYNPRFFRWEMEKMKVGMEHLCNVLLPLLQCHLEFYWILLSLELPLYLVVWKLYSMPASFRLKYSSFKLNIMYNIGIALLEYFMIIYHTFHIAIIYKIFINNEVLTFTFDSKSHSYSLTFKGGRKSNHYI